MLDFFQPTMILFTLETNVAHNRFVLPYNSCHYPIKKFTLHQILFTFEGFFCARNKSNMCIRFVLPCSACVCARRNYIVHYIFLPYNDISCGKNKSCMGYFFFTLQCLCVCQKEIYREIYLLYFVMLLFELEKIQCVIDLCYLAILVFML